MALLQIRFCKKFLGSSFFGDAVDTDIHEEQKDELTTKFAAKDRICNDAIINIGSFKQSGKRLDQRIVDEAIYCSLRDQLLRL